MQVGTQFTGTIAAGATKSWFSHSWNPTHHVVWTVIPVSASPGAPQIEWDVRTQRASETTITYWIVIRNLSAAGVDIEARFAIMN